jgi:hypothetical protein
MKTTKKPVVKTMTIFELARRGELPPVLTVGELMDVLKDFPSDLMIEQGDRGVSLVIYKDVFSGELSLSFEEVYEDDEYEDDEEEGC